MLPLHQGDCVMEVASSQLIAVRFPVSRFRRADAVRVRNSMEDQKQGGGGCCCCCFGAPSVAEHVVRWKVHRFRCLRLRQKATCILSRSPPFVCSPTAFCSAGNSGGGDRTPRMEVCVGDIQVKRPLSVRTKKKKRGNTSKARFCERFGSRQLCCLRPTTHVCRHRRGEGRGETTAAATMMPPQRTIWDTFFAVVRQKAKCGTRRGRVILRQLPAT